MDFLEKFKAYGVGRRGYDDKLFLEDEPPAKYGLYDEDEEVLCHQVIKTTCQVPGCIFTAESLLEFENHYNTLHRYACSQCKKNLPSPHLLDLHIQESHDSFFAVLATRKPSYACYIEECKEKFLDTKERLEHCVKIHRIPKDYRFDQSHGAQKGKKNKNKKQYSAKNEMEVDLPQTKQEGKTKKFAFANSKHKAFSTYTGKKFTDESKKGDKNVDIDEAMEDLKHSLPI